MKYYKIRCYHIEWDTDGDKRTFNSLPQEVFYEGSIFDENEDEIDEILCDYLSDNYGFCIYKFNYEILEERTIEYKED